MFGFGRQHQVHVTLPAVSGMVAAPANLDSLVYQYLATHNDVVATPGFANLAMKGLVQMIADHNDVLTDAMYSPTVPFADGMLARPLALTNTTDDDGWLLTTPEVEDFLRLIKWRLEVDLTDEETCDHCGGIQTVKLQYAIPECPWAVSVLPLTQSLYQGTVTLVWRQSK